MEPISVPVCSYTPVPEELLFIPLIEESSVDTFGKPIDVSLECLAIIDVVRDNHNAIRGLGKP